MDEKLRAVKVGFQVYLEEGGKDFGGVREVAPQGRDEIIVYIENAGEFVIPAPAVQSVHDGKVILNRAQLEPTVLDAIAHAHDQEVPGL